MARLRSPNYPALGLPDAIERARGIYSKQQSTPEPREVVIRHMGYNSVNGRAQKSLSALIKYGLLEEAGKGLRISARAKAILFPASATDKAHAIAEAAREPELFNRIIEEKGPNPSQESLKHFLIHEGFNMNAVDQVARAFYTTLALVGNEGMAYESSEIKEEEETVQQPEPITPKVAAAAGYASATGSAKAVGVSLNSTKPVFDFETVSINTKIDNQEDLEELIQRLEKLKAMLPNKTQH